MDNHIICNVEYIKNFMVQNKISLNKLAEEMDISPATLSRILNKQRNPGQMVIGKMLNYFDISFEVLFSYNFELTKVNGKQQKRVAI